MIGLFCFVLAALASPFKSKLRLEAENTVLRHQLIVLRRKLHGRVRLTNNDRWFLIQLYRWFPSILQVLTIIRPETLVRWHRAGFRCYWRWKSRPLGGRPQIETDLRSLIRRMSVENPLWGAPRIHGELLKLGFEVAQSSVAKYMVKRRAPPSQGWRTFLHNHAPDIAAMDLFVVPTIGFDLLYAFIIVRLDRRELVWISVTTHPTAEWVARQIVQAFPWDEAPRYLIRDRDRIYGTVVTRRLRAMGIRDKPIAPASPWQNGIAERLIGSIRRECLDHIIVFGEAHLRRILKSYADYYNSVRTHRSLHKDAPISRPIHQTGVIRSQPILGGLHHHYVRVLSFRYTQARACKGEGSNPWSEAETDRPSAKRSDRPAGGWRSAYGHSAVVQCESQYHQPTPISERFAFPRAARFGPGYRMHENIKLSGYPCEQTSIDENTESVDVFYIARIDVITYFQFRELVPTGGRF